jgi:hypothetical protein
MSRSSLSNQFAPELVTASNHIGSAKVVTCQLMCVVLVILIQVILSTGAAIAQSPTGAIKEFGLVGIWADDCKADPSAANQYASFSVTSRGVVELRNDFGPDYDNMLYRIVDAKRIGQFRISLRQLLTTDDRIALDIVMLKAKDKLRVWSSRGADGREYVRDGLIPAANNFETRWMQRCDTRWAGSRDSAPVESGHRRKISFPYDPYPDRARRD